MGWSCSINLEKRKAYTIFYGKPEGRKQLGRVRRRWEDNIKIHPRGIGWRDRHWIDLAQYSNQWRIIVNTVMNLMIS
jgi:hypothetical protein